MAVSRVAITVVFSLLLMFSSPTTIYLSFNLPDSVFGPQENPDSISSNPGLQKSNHQKALKLPPPNTPLILKNMSITGFSSGHGLIRCQEGGYAFLSSCTSENGLSALVLVRLDDECNVIWNHTYSYNRNIWAYLLIECQDGGFAIFSNFGCCADWDICFIRTDSNGVHLWNLTYYVPLPIENIPIGCVETPEGGFGLLMQFQTSYQSTNRFWLVRTDSDGIMLWNYTFPSIPSSFLACQDGSFLVVRKTTEYSINAISLSQISPTGSHLWTQRYYGPEIPDYTWGKIIECSDEGFAISGSSTEIGHDSCSFGLLRVNDTGALLWSQYYYQIGQQYFSSFTETSDGGFILIGRSYGYDMDIENAFLLRTDPQGLPIWNVSWEISEFWSISTDSIILCPDGTYVTLCINVSYSPDIRMLYLMQFYDPLPNFVYDLSLLIQFWLILWLGLAVVVTFIYGIYLLRKKIVRKGWLSSSSKEEVQEPRN